MYKGLGFKTEGHLVEARRAGGKYWNAYYMAMLEEEWLGRDEDRRDRLSRSSSRTRPAAGTSPGPGRPAAGPHVPAGPLAAGCRPASPPAPVA